MLADDKLMILQRIARHVRLTEHELRFQVKRDGHPEAESPELIFDLAALERDGLVDVWMEFSLTPKGKEALSGTPV
jgi:hypothetical protein